MHEFVQKYQETIGKQWFNEKNLDFKMNNETKLTRTPNLIENYLRVTFTPDIFNDFLIHEFVINNDMHYII